MIEGFENDAPVHHRAWAAFRRRRNRGRRCDRRRRFRSAWRFARGGREEVRVLDAEPRRRAPQQAYEFQRFQKRQQRRGVGIANGEFRDIGFERNVVIELDETTREPRLLRILDQRLAAFGLLDLVRACKQRLEVAIFADQFRRGFDADSGNARHVVGRVADQALHFDDFLRRHAEALDHLGGTDPLVLHRVEHLDQVIVDELHQVLVGRDDGNLGAGLAAEPRIGRDQIIGFEALFLDTGDAEGANRVAGKRELRHQIIRRLGAIRLVLAEHRIAEAHPPGIENHRKMRRLIARLGILKELPQHVAEAGNGARRKAVGFARQGRQCVVGAEDEARTVDEINVIAGPDLALESVLQNRQWLSASPLSRASRASSLRTNGRSQ